MSVPTATDFHEYYLASTRRALSDPRCFTCKAPATHATARITPAGVHALACDDHVPKRPERLWGNDPGWVSEWVPIEQARPSMESWIAILERDGVA